MFQEAFFGSEILFKSRESLKDTLKSLDSDEEKGLAEPAKLFTDTSVKDESSIQISSQIRKELAEMPKPSTVEGSEKGQDLKEPLDQDAAIGGSLEPTDLQILEDVSDFDIDDNFIKMIESELEVGGTHLDNDIESGNYKTK